MPVSELVQNDIDILIYTFPPRLSVCPFDLTTFVVSVLKILCEMCEKTVRSAV